MTETVRVVRPVVQMLQDGAKPACAECVFFRLLDSSLVGGLHMDKLGECRRYPVTHYAGRLHWCGEFEPQVEPS